MSAESELQYPGQKSRVLNYYSHIITRKYLAECRSPALSSILMVFISFLSEHRKSARPFGHVNRRLWSVILDSLAFDNHLHLSLEVKVPLSSIHKYVFSFAYLYLCLKP